MGLFSMQSLALKWSYLFSDSGIIVFNEYVNLYMKQLGFSPAQIGFTALMGIQHLCLPLFAYLGDRFRARKLVLIALTVLLIIFTFAPLLPLVVSLPTCFVRTSASPTDPTSNLSKEYFLTLNIHSNMSLNRSSNPFSHPTNEELDSRISQRFKVLKILTPVKEVKRNNYVPWLSTLFVYMAITRALVTLVDRAFLMLQNLATITYLKEKRASYGSYQMWAHIGGGVSLFAVGLISSNTKLSLCGFIGDGYHVTFVWTTVAIMLSSFAIPLLKYEYHKHRVINWTEVKTILYDFHYIIVLIVAFYIGCCTAFQIYWEFWYISELSGSSTIMGVAGLIRRPLLALWFYLSGFLIEKVGDLKIIAASLFLFSVSFLAISFISIPWIILAIDLLQSAAYGFSYSGLNVHFSKVGSKSSSAVVLGLLEMVYAIGLDAGSGFMGLLFNAIGLKPTLLCYSVTTAIILVGFLAYICFGKDLDEYEKLPEDSDDEVPYEGIKYHN